jgi:lysophospholipase L1-like esterase
VLKKLLLQITLSILSVGVALLALELLLQVISYEVEAPREHRICENCSYLYEPIPHAGRLNSFGFSGPETTLKKPQDTLRVLIVGDSVSYGSGVEDKDTFPRVLQSLLHTEKKIEVINAGVRGYTTYNEARYLRDKLFDFSPDLVILQTCMNDITNPSWHWNAVSTVALTPPDEAYPNLELKNSPLRSETFFGKIIGKSLLYTIGTIAYLKYTKFETEKHIGIDQDGKFWPTYITAESDQTLLPYLDYQSREWIWLRTQLDVALGVAKKKSVPLALLIVPMSFELDPEYPFDPEANFLRYCKESGIPCLNLIDTFKGKNPKELYLLNSNSKLPKLSDVWHFNAQGHKTTAELLASFIQSNHLLER